MGEGGSVPIHQYTVCVGEKYGLTECINSTICADQLNRCCSFATALVVYFNTKMAGVKRVIDSDSIDILVCLFTISV